MISRTSGAAVVELAYTYVSGTYGRKPVRVQVPPAAPLVRDKITLTYKQIR